MYLFSLVMAQLWSCHDEETVAHLLAWIPSAVPHSGVLHGGTYMAKEGA